MRHQQFRQILILVVVVLSLFLIQELILTTHSTAKSSDTTISSNTTPETTTPQTSAPPDSQQIIHHPPSSLPVINDAQELVMVEFEKLAEDHYLEKVFKNFTSPKPAAFGDCKFTKLYDAPTISPTPINNPTDTDFTNTPTSKLRPTFTYEFSQFPESCTGDVQPTLITIVLLYHNQSEYQKMLELIYAQSFQLWQLQIVVPADEEHNHQLENEVGDQRVFITHLPSKLWSTPPSLKNKILENITTSYLLYWNGQDLLEPTFLEKCIWYLETHQNVPICGSHFISFNGIEEYWDHGYENSTWTLNSSIIHLSPVLRTSEMRKIGGYNSDSIRGLEDWELLLKFGELGYQGFTIQEPLWWYNTPKSRDSLSLLTDKQIEHFSKKFPRIFMEKMLPFNKTNSDVPSWIRAMWKVQYRPKITKKMNFTLPFIQYVPSTYRPRALFILPFLEMGGSDHYNLEIIRSLAQRGWEISIVTTHLSSNPFLSDALKYSPDIFLLPNFLEWIDFQRFLCYFLRSRAPDLLLLTNSFVGYQFLPYMDSFCPCHKKPVIVDIVHSFTETWWMNGGYPYMSVHQQQYIDRTISTSQDLSNWMYQRGKDKKNVAVLYLGTNVTMFSLEGMNTTAMKKERDVPLDTKIFLWVGRFHHEKRPQVFVDAARILLEKGINNFYALVIGSGKQYSLVKSVLESNPNVANNVRLLGELEPEEIKLWMAISDVLVVTSITEGTPLVIFEALSMQNFVLSTNVGAISEQVDPSTGILVDISPLNKTRWELESHLFAHEMDHILNIPTSDLRNGGEIARKKSVELFNSDYYIDMFINELCAAERECTTRVRPAPVQYDDKKLKELLYNSMRFIML